MLTGQALADALHQRIPFELPVDLVETVFTDHSYLICDHHWPHPDNRSLAIIGHKALYRLERELQIFLPDDYLEPIIRTGMLLHPNWLATSAARLGLGHFVLTDSPETQRQLRRDPVALARVMRALIGAVKCHWRSAITRRFVLETHILPLIQEGVCYEYKGPVALLEERARGEFQTSPLGSCRGLSPDGQIPWCVYEYALEVDEQEIYRGCGFGPKVEIAQKQAAMRVLAQLNWLPDLSPFTAGELAGLSHPQRLLCFYPNLSEVEASWLTEVTEEIIEHCQNTRQWFASPALKPLLAYAYDLRKKGVAQEPVVNRTELEEESPGSFGE